MKKFIILGISLLLLSSCANQSDSPGTTVLTGEPIQYESFEVSIRQVILDGETRVCGDFSQEQFWIPGVFGEELSSQLDNSIRLFVDGDNIQFDEGLDIVRADNGFAEYDDNGNLIGTYGGWFSVCINISDSDSGSHTATLEVRDLLNQPRRFTWDFVIEE